MKQKHRIASTSLLALPALIAPTLCAPQSIGFSGTMPDLKNVEVDSSHVYDYTFTKAPADWWVQSGVWEMTNRWSCSPQWSWFGGRSEEIAAIWNKRRFQGDLSIQYYFAFKMGLAGTPRWNYHPADVACSFFGDGQRLNSGYTLILGADGNRHSILMHGNKVVADSSAPEALLPTWTDGNPDAGDTEYSKMHRHWWYVRINKIGSHIECWLDNKLLFSYEDPKPFDAGQMALWTYNNGIMLSRVQVYYEKELHPTYVKTAMPAPQQIPFKRSAPAHHAVQVALR